MKRFTFVLAIVAGSAVVLGAQAAEVLHLPFDSSLDPATNPAASGAQINTTNPAVGAGCLELTDGTATVIVEDFGLTTLTGAFSIACWLNIDEDGLAVGLGAPVVLGFQAVDAADLWDDTVYMFLEPPWAGLYSNPVGGALSEAGFDVGAEANGLWHHYVIIVDGAGNAAMFMDGVDQGVMSVSITADPADPVFKVGFSGPTSAPQVPFVGLMDDIHVYDHELGQSEVDALMAGAEGEGEGEGEGGAEGELDLPEPVTSGVPVVGMMGLSVVAAACALGGALAIRKR